MTERTLKLIWCVLFLGLLPMCFGGAHHLTWFTFAGIAAFLAAAIPFNLQSHTAHESSRTSSPRLYQLIHRREYLVLGSLVLAVATVLAVHTLRSAEHPVLGAIHFARNDSATMSLVAGILLFSSPFFLFLASDGRMMRYAIMISGMCIAAIGLAQWTSDNGLLLWSFAPEYVFESSRARWPFVNSNHLGAFLIAPLLLSVDEIAEAGLRAFRNRADRKSFHRTKHAHRNTGAILGLISALFCGTALIATQSRNAWVIGACALLALITVKVLTLEMTRRERIQVGVAAVVFAALMVWSLSFSDRLADAVAQRVDSSAATTLDDLRFQYFSDSLLLLRERPLTGAGPGGFVRDIETVSRPALAGLNPMYLHNDALQFFVEYGLIAGGLLLLAVFLFAQGSYATITIYIYSLLLLSCFEFPFRIGALVLQCGAMIALGRTTRTERHHS